MTSWIPAALIADEPAQLLPARSQMAFTLAFHIVLVPIGVALPAIMLIAHHRGLRTGDAVALTLARRWSHAAALTFAVGAVTGTVLSFEMGLLWPGLTGGYGEVFGLPFQIEAIAFLLEAILITIYIYGWTRLRPWTHFWLGVPIPFVAIVGAFSVIAANSWMNQRAGFDLASDGRLTNVDPWAAVFNAALPYELPHFLLAASWRPASPWRRSTSWGGCAAAGTATTGSASSSRSRWRRSPRPSRSWSVTRRPGRWPTTSR